MNYVDGMVAAVPTENKEAYLEHSLKVAQVFKDNGALSYTECWGDDVPEGEMTSLIKAVKCEPNETVVFSWIRWPTKDVRDDGMKKAMTDPRMSFGDNPMPFDGKRMIFGGFNVIVDE